MYINLVLEGSQLSMPLLEAPSERPAGSATHGNGNGHSLPGLFLEWNQLRVGYFFGGDGQCLTRLNAFELATWASLPDGSTQVRHNNSFHSTRCEVILKLHESVAKQCLTRLNAFELATWASLPNGSTQVNVWLLFSAHNDSSG